MKPMQEVSAPWYFVCLFHDDCLNTFRSMRSKYNKKTALQITQFQKPFLMLVLALLIHNMPNSSIVFGLSYDVILYLHIPGILET